jgi:hypothetical protein
MSSSVSHTKILYRQFLFRLMDVEFLAASARGDASELFGQFGAMLMVASLALSYAALIFNAQHPAAPMRWLAARLLMEATMLTVGIFALLSWESTFPDRRDVQILSPLPVKTRELFTAKIAASAAALGLTILALNCFGGLVWPGALVLQGQDVVVHLRFMAAYWITAVAAGLFTYCCVLGIQGFAGLLPRAWFLRVSSFLQIGLLALFIAVLFLQPSMITAQSFSAPENQTALAWLPTYWFMGMFVKLSGATSIVAMDVLARRAWLGLAAAVVIASAAFLLSYLRTIRKIAEEPDILPGSRGGMWLPPFGSGPRTALAQFIIRTLARSRQHRMNLAFFIGVGFAMAAVKIQATVDERLLTILMMLCMTVLGIKVSFARPLDLRANWMFQVLPVEGGKARSSAVRRALLFLAVLPVWIGAALVLIRSLPLAEAARHLALIAGMGALLVEIVLMGFRKIPFACSYLPGKSRIHVMMTGSLFFVPVVLTNWVDWQQAVVAKPWLFAVAAAGLVAVNFAIRKLFPPEEAIQFEEFPSDQLVVLDL